MLPVVLAPVVPAVPLQAQIVRQLTDTKVDDMWGWAVDDAGDSLVLLSSADFGGNPDHAFEVVNISLPDGTPVPVSDLARGTAASISISDDWTWIAFLSPDDPLGQNHDGSLELFLISDDGATIVQLTDLMPLHRR